MRSKAMFTVVLTQLVFGIALGETAAQERPVTVTAIPGVIQAGAQWQIAAVTFENADGITGTPDGSVVWASPPTSRVSGLDKDGKVKVFWEHTNGAGALAFVRDGRIFAVMRDKTSNNGAAPYPAFGLISPETKILADNYQGDKFQGAGDLASDRKGGVYFVE